MTAVASEGANVPEKANGAKANDLRWDHQQEWNKRREGIEDRIWRSLDEFTKELSSVGNRLASIDGGIRLAAWVIPISLTFIVAVVGGVVALVVMATN